MSNVQEHMIPSGAWPEVGSLDREPPLRAAELLERALSVAVLPRLVAAHRDVPLLPVPADVLELSGLVLQARPDPAALFVEQVRLRGVSVERVFTDLLTPAARRLGVLWEQDLCDFTQVTLGVGRLGQMMRELAPRFQDEQASPISDRTVLLTPGPGEDHTFGLSMVAEYFRRDGWLVRRAQPRTPDEMSRLVRAHWCAVVGISVGSTVRLRTLRDGIAEVRRRSRNRDVVVMVGGPAFIERPELALELGADATASDGQQAVWSARTLVDRALVGLKLVEQSAAASRTD